MEPCCWRLEALHLPGRFASEEDLRWCGQERVQGAETPVKAHSPHAKEPETKNASAPSAGHADDCRSRCGHPPRLPWDRVQNQEARGKPFIFFSEAMCHVVSFSEVPTNQ